MAFKKGRRPSSLAVPSAPPPMPASAPEQHDYRAEMDADTLQRAQEIMGDEARHQRAVGHMEQRHAALGKAIGKAPQNTGGDRVGQGFRRLTPQ